MTNHIIGRTNSVETFRFNDIKLNSCGVIAFQTTDIIRSHCEVISLTRAMLRLTLWSTWSQIACFYGKQVYG